MMRTDFQKHMGIFYAEDQEQLELAMWGKTLDWKMREYIKQMAFERIEQHREGDEVGYKSAACIDLGIVQMGLEEDYYESGFSVLRGIEASFPGSEYHIINASMFGGCVLVHWTNRANDNSLFRCSHLLGFLMRKLRDAAQFADYSQRGALSLPDAWLTVFSLVWGQVIDREIRSNSREFMSDYTKTDRFKDGIQAAEAIDNFTQNQLSVCNWMINKIRMINETEK